MWLPPVLSRSVYLNRGGEDEVTRRRSHGRCLAEPRADPTAVLRVTPWNPGQSLKRNRVAEPGFLSVLLRWPRCRRHRVSVSVRIPSVWPRVCSYIYICVCIRIGSGVDTPPAPHMDGGEPPSPVCTPDSGVAERLAKDGALQTAVTSPPASRL